MTNPHLKVLGVFLLALVLDSSCQTSVNLDNVDFRIKWITPTSRFPIKIEKRIDNRDVIPFEADFKWYRFPDKQFINEIDDYEQIYRYRQTRSKIELDVLKYDQHSHDQISSYIALPVAMRSDEPASMTDRSDIDMDFRNEMFTTAYLARQEIEFEPGWNSVNFSCTISVLIPYGERSLNDFNTELVQKNLDFKMGFVDTHDFEDLRLGYLKKGKGKDKPHVKYTQQLERTNRRDKRSARKNLVAFLQIIEKIGPIVVAKDDLDMLKDDELFCTIELHENSAGEAEGSEIKKTVYRNHIQKKLGEFSGERSDDYVITDGDSAPSLMAHSFFKLFYSITAVLVILNLL